MSLLQKTFKAHSPEEIDRLVNDWSKKHDVKSSHTNQLFVVDRLFYFATLFYKDE